jgi:hypothetical protein
MAGGKRSGEGGGQEGNGQEKESGKEGEKDSEPASGRSLGRYSQSFLQAEERDWRRYMRQVIILSEINSPTGGWGAVHTQLQQARGSPPGAS